MKNFNDHNTDEVQQNYFAGLLALMIFVGLIAWCLLNDAPFN